MVLRCYNPKFPKPLVKLLPPEAGATAAPSIFPNAVPALEITPDVCLLPKITATNANPIIATTIETKPSISLSLTIYSQRELFHFRCANDRVQLLAPERKQLAQSMKLS